MSNTKKDKMVQKTFFLKDGNKEEFLECCKNYIVQMMNDDYLKTFAVITDDDPADLDKNVVHLRFILEDPDNVYEWLKQKDEEQGYWQSFLKDIKGLEHKENETTHHVVEIFHHDISDDIPIKLSQTKSA